MTRDAESEAQEPGTMPGLPYDWGAQPVIKGTGVVLEIEIQEAQEDALVDVQRAHGGVLLHRAHPEPQHRGVIHTVSQSVDVQPLKPGPDEVIDHGYTVSTEEGGVLIFKNLFHVAQLLAQGDLHIRAVSPASQRYQAFLG